MTTSPGNPGLPSNVYGIKIEEPDIEGTTWTLMFESLRVPVWGDFYAKGGSSNFAFNVGFTSPDTDPDDQIGLNHIPVPDSQLLIIPEATSIVAWSMLLALGACVNRRWLSC